MFTSTQPCLILSPARTGSTALADYISEKFYNNAPVLDHPNCITDTDVLVGRSHELYDSGVLNQFMVIFNIRENIVDTVVSRILANHFEIWNWPESKPESLKPFVADLMQVGHATDQQMAWYEHYIQFLTSLSHVVSYEVYTEIIPLPTWEKLSKDLVINLKEVVNHIESLLTDSFKSAHGAFVDWKTLPNRSRIYLELQGHNLN